MINKSTKFYYYTPINIKINFQNFIKYSEQLENDNNNENIANLMNEIENMIISSEAYNLQTNKPIITQNRWQTIKIKQISLTSICLILNKLNEKNINEMIKESKNYFKFTLEELNQLADFFLGKCIMENNKIKLFIEYLKSMIKCKLWYIKYNNIIISFRDCIFNRLENEYDRLTRIAGYIEDVFKNKIKDYKEYDNLNGAEDYLKKKNIILNLINLIGTFFLEKIISFKLLTNIFKQLKDEYINSITKKIYLELWIILWNNVAETLKINFNEYYNEQHNWLINIKNKLINSIEKISNNDDYNNTHNGDNIHDSLDSDDAQATHEQHQYNYESNILRIIGLIDNKNNISIINNTDLHNKSFYELNNEIKNCITNDDYEKIKKYDKELINKYVIKYLLSLNNLDINNGINNILKIINNIELNDIINYIINNDDIICDYPNFKKLINNLNINK
jgi:hypothetical protein